LFAERAHNKGLELACRIAPALPAAVVGDPHRVRQVLCNLVSNAIKFTEAGDVSIEVVPAGESACAAESVLRFSVRDTGVGIHPEVRARLFQPFSQADNSTTRKFGGTGLGLAIVKQLTEMMGGTVGM
jgi:signal transduction histidine kinase